MAKLFIAFILPFSADCFNKSILSLESLISVRFDILTLFFFLVNYFMPIFFEKKYFSSLNRKKNGVKSPGVTVPCTDSGFCICDIFLLSLLMLMGAKTHGNLFHCPLP